MSAARKIAAWVSRPRNSHLDTVFIAMIVLAINDEFWFAVGVLAIVGSLASWALQRFAGDLLLVREGGDGK